MGLNFPRYTRCIHRSVLNTVHTFMVLLEVRDGVGRCVCVCVGGGGLRVGEVAVGF